jgi:hypothetical protein
LLSSSGANPISIQSAVTNLKLAIDISPISLPFSRAENYPILGNISPHVAVNVDARGGRVDRTAKFREIRVLVRWRDPMATVHLSNRLDPGARLRNIGVEEVAGAPATSTSGLRTPSVAGRRLLGVVLLLLGILTTSTLVLLPVGVPLSILAVALIAAPSE